MLSLLCNLPVLTISFTCSWWVQNILRALIRVVLVVHCWNLSTPQIHMKLLQFTFANNSPKAKTASMKSLRCWLYSCCLRGIPRMICILHNKLQTIQLSVLRIHKEPTLESLHQWSPDCWPLSSQIGIIRSWETPRLSCLGVDRSSWLRLQRKRQHRAPKFHKAYNDAIHGKQHQNLSQAHNAPAEIKVYTVQYINIMHFSFDDLCVQAALCGLFKQEVNMYELQCGRNCVSPLSREFTAMSHKSNIVWLRLVSWSS